MFVCAHYRSSTTKIFTLNYYFSVLFLKGLQNYMQRLLLNVVGWSVDLFNDVINIVVNT